MGTKIYLEKVLGSVLIFLFYCTGANAQVVIKEKVEINPEQATNYLPITENVVGPGGYYHPVLHQIGRGTYLVLKSGMLKFYIEEAQSYGVEQVEDHVLNYSVSGPSTSITNSADIVDHLGTPILINEGADPSCNGTQAYFIPEMEYPIGPTDDTWIKTGFEGTAYGDSAYLDARGFGFSPPQHPDQTISTSYLQFGIGQFETNANLKEAYFLIAADTSITDYNNDFFIYPVTGPWNEETLSSENRPPTNTNDYLVVTAEDTVPSAGLIYAPDLTEFVSGWINGTIPDHGIRIASSSRHIFQSKESFFGTVPTIGLQLSLPEESINPILELGYVQAGDTLMLDYMGISDNFRPTFTNNPVNADDRLSFFKYSNCQTHTYLNLLPHMEENTAQSPYFEFALSNELTLPSDEQGYRDMYIEPNILYDNGLASLPGWIFSNYFASLHEVSPVDIPEGTPGLPGGIMPVALLDGSPNGWAPFSPYNTGTTIDYLSHPLAIGKTFKLVIAGIIRKGGGIATKSNPNAPDLQDITQVIQGAFSESYPDLSVATANCGLNPFGEDREGLFVSCFEFTIRGDAPEISLVLPEPREVWPTLRTRDGGNPDGRNIKNFVVTVTKDEEPVPGYEIKISGVFIPNSGGHDHENTIPQNKLGTFKNTSNGESVEGVLLTQTDENGRIPIEYVASELGGELEILVEDLSTSSTVKDTITVRVPNLEYLGTSDFFELVGSPQFNNTTNDPCRAPDSFTSLHNLGHFGIPKFNSAIKDLAQSFFVRNDSTKLRINDMSLEKGGVFDTKNNWTPPHAAHRVGIQGDIGIRTILKNGNCNTDQSPDLILSEILNSQQFVNTITYSSHYHVRIK